MDMEDGVQDSKSYDLITQIIALSLVLLKRHFLNRRPLLRHVCLPISKSLSIPSLSGGLEGVAIGSICRIHEKRYLFDHLVYHVYHELV